MVKVDVSKIAAEEGIGNPVFLSPRVYGHCLQSGCLDLNRDAENRLRMLLANLRFVIGDRNGDSPFEPKFCVSLTDGHTLSDDAVTLALCLGQRSLLTGYVPVTVVFADEFDEIAEKASARENEGQK